LLTRFEYNLHAEKHHTDVYQYVCGNFQNKTDHSPPNIELNDQFDAMKLENEKHLFYLLSLENPPSFPEEMLTQKEEEYAKRLFDMTKAKYHRCLKNRYAPNDKHKRDLWYILEYLPNPLTGKDINLPEFANFIFKLPNNINVVLSASVHGSSMKPTTIQIEQSRLVLAIPEDYRVPNITNAYLKVMQTIFKYHFGPVYVPFNVAKESFIKQYVQTDSANLKETKNKESGMTPGALDMKLRDEPNLNLTPTPSKLDWYSVAKGILEFESKLAALLESLPRKSKAYARTSLLNMEKEYPGIGLDVLLSMVYYRDSTIPMENEIIVHNPTFFKKLGSILQSTRSEVINYYAWILSIQIHVQSLDGYTQYVWNAFEFTVEAFSTRSQTSSGKRKCVQHAFSDFVGARWFAASKLPLSSKTKVTEMFSAIKREFEHRVPSYTWLDAATRRGMKNKLSNMIVTIGYPKRYMSIMELAAYKGLLKENTKNDKFVPKIDTPMSPNAAREFFYSEWEEFSSEARAYYRRYQNIMVRTIPCFPLKFLHT
jgi:hypothetical protein